MVNPINPSQPVQPDTVQQVNDVVRVAVKQIDTAETPRPSFPPQKDEKALNERKQFETADEAREFVDELNEQLAQFNTIEFKVNEVLHRIVFTIFDKETEEVIREVPLEEVQHTFEKLQELRDSINNLPSPGTIIETEA
jgi:uncharacterized FlaG/YvyC family protein